MAAVIGHMIAVEIGLLLAICGIGFLDTELSLKVDGAVKSRFILGAGPSIFGHDYIARQKDR